MKIRILMTLVVLAVTACTQPKVQDEIFDSITTTIYNNHYNEEDKLLFINITEYKEEYVNGRYILKNTNKLHHKYKYIDDIIEISQISDCSPDVVSVTTIGPNTDTHYSIQNGVDTLYYIQSTYLDKEKSKLTYNRYIWNSALQNNARENHESYYYYDDKGNNNRIVKHNFITGEDVETYILYDFSHKDTVKLAPKERGVQIAHCFEKEKGDTTIIDYQFNGEATYSVKKYKDVDKMVSAKFDPNSNLIEKDISYKENGLDITIKEISDLNMIDSTYYIAGKEVRRVSIDSESKSVVTSEYDDIGNISKKVKKSVVTTTEADINDMLQVIQESKK